MKKKKEKKTTKLSLKKFTVAKLNRLNQIRGGSYGTNDTGGTGDVPIIW